MAEIIVNPNVRTYSKSGSAQLSGDVTLSEGSGVLITQFGPLLVVGGLTTALIIGPVDSVASGSTSAALIAGASAGVMVMPFAGRVLAISLSLSTARTAGTCTARYKKNGVADTTNTAVCDGTNTQRKATIFGTPVSFAAGDRIDLETVTSGFTPTAADATIGLFIDIGT